MYFARGRPAAGAEFVLAPTPPMGAPAAAEHQSTSRLPTPESVIEISRRQFLYLAVGAVLPSFSGSARGQTYPSRSVRIIVGFPPGGAADITARLIGKWLSERLGQPFVIENRPGAGTNIGTETVAKAPADGYTLLLVSVANTVNATLYERLNFDFIRDIAPVAGLLRGPLVMELNPSVPAKTIPEFIAYAKANPGKINVASAGNGTPGHMASELFQLMTGLDLVDVPYRGGAPALTDLLAGQVQVIFDNLPTSLGYIRARKVRPLAVTTAARSDALPEVPTVSEFVPGYEVSSWFGIGLPRNTPTEIVDKLSDFPAPEAFFYDHETCNCPWAANWFILSGEFLLGAAARQFVN